MVDGQEGDAFSKDLYFLILLPLPLESMIKIWTAGLLTKLTAESHLCTWLYILS